MKGFLISPGARFQTTWPCHINVASKTQRKWR